MKPTFAALAAVLLVCTAVPVSGALGKDKVGIEIVAYGPDINMLKADSLVGNRIEDATKDGVKVVACEHTMTNQKLAKDDMLRGIGYVTTGVLEIIVRQKEGWGHMRP